MIEQTSQLIKDLQKQLLELQRDSERKVVGLIEECSKNQREIWQQIPYYALEADGRWGYFHNDFHYAYVHGFWPVASGGCIYNNYYKRSIYYVGVDLETGRLINSFKFPEIVAAMDNRIAQVRAEDLDAPKILEYLKERALAPNWDCGPENIKEINTRRIDEWRNKKRAELGLEKIYTRKKS